LDDLSGVLDAMHAEKSSVLRGQLAGIAVEIGERERISKFITTSLETESLDLGSIILNLTRPEVPDLYLKERIALSEHRRSLHKELREEHIGHWRDIQELRREHRQIEQELVQAGQRRQRLEDLTRVA
jgi:hypothetical protein